MCFNGGKCYKVSLREILAANDQTDRRFTNLKKKIGPQGLVYPCLYIDVHDHYFQSPDILSETAQLIEAKIHEELPGKEGKL